MLIVLGCGCFALGFDLFLAPNDLNIGGVSGAAMLLTELLGCGSIGLFTIILNVPLFLMGWRVLGRRFFLGSLAGMLLSSVFVDLLAFLPPLHTETLLDSLYGGLLTGVGLGLVLLAGASTGGSDILARLLKKRIRSAHLGRVILATDLVVVALTGVVFRDASRALYSAVPLAVSSAMIDVVLYGLDDSSVALIITDQWQTVNAAIMRELERGTTLLEAEGGYTGEEKKVLLTAIRRRQVPKLKDIVREADENAFLILQEAHQVLGRGFGDYTEI